MFSFPISLVRFPANRALVISSSVQPLKPSSIDEMSSESSSEPKKCADLVRFSSSNSSSDTRWYSSSINIANTSSCKPSTEDEDDVSLWCFFCWCNGGDDDRLWLFEEPGFFRELLFWLELPLIEVMLSPWCAFGCLGVVGVLLCAPLLDSTIANDFCLSRLFQCRHFDKELNQSVAWSCLHTVGNEYLDAVTLIWSPSESSVNKFAISCLNSMTHALIQFFHVHQN